jgi:hypothetical protein
MLHKRVRAGKGLLAVAAVAAFALAGTPRDARASLFFGLQEAGVNGGAIFTVGSVPDFTSGSFTGTYGDFTVTIFGGASDNGQTLSDLLSSTTSVTNNSGTSKTLNLWVSQTDYTLPAGTPLRVESGMGGSVNTGTLTLTNMYQAYADKNNLAYGTGDFTNGPQTGVMTGSTFQTGSMVGSFDRTAGQDYSLTSLTAFTLSGNGKANFSNEIDVTAIPEPTTPVTAFTSLGLLGALGWLRRRRA